MSENGGPAETATNAGRKICLCSILPCGERDTYAVRFADQSTASVGVTLPGSSSASTVWAHLKRKHNEARSAGSGVNFDLNLESNWTEVALSSIFLTTVNLSYDKAMSHVAKILWGMKVIKLVSPAFTTVQCATALANKKIHRQHLRPEHFLKKNGGAGGWRHVCAHSSEYICFPVFLFCFSF
jgi:hypothetical protein